MWLVIIRLCLIFSPTPPLPSPPLSQDGRLNQDDLLLQINEGSVLNMNSEDVISRLKAVSQAGQPIRLVVARAVDSPEPEVCPEINYVRESVCVCVCEACIM